MSKQPYIYLASQSPRRSELLKQIGVNFQILLSRSDPRRTPDVDETPLPDELPLAYVQRICQAKGRAGWKALIHRNLPQMPVLSADTTVTVDGHILGKPLDRVDAAAMLRKLSGRTHQVLTAVAVTQGAHFEMRVSSSEVRFAALNEERIQRYVHGDEAHDKAGAYGIQGIAGAFIEHLSGSYSGVMGLPLFETTELLHSFGYPAP
ncbi:MAG TPA: Maf family protein [Gallionellaceae bacterium]|nr:Maf family protein [Gallionellaceae bacterium]